MSTEDLKLSKEDLELCRQWFDNVQDLNPQYLERADYELAHRIYQALGMRPANSITSVLGLPPAPSKADQWPPEVAARMLDIKRRTPFHLQSGRRSQVFVSGGKPLTPATDAEIAELQAWEASRLEPK